MRVVFAGTPTVAVPSLRALIASTHEVVAVVTRPPARTGRGRQLRDSPVAEVASEQGIPVLTPARPGEPDFLEKLRELAPECCPVVAYGALLPKDALEIPTHGWVNLHFSLLPAWRGAAPVQHTILSGDDVAGASTFLIEEGLDTGPVFGLITETVRLNDTSGELLERLAEHGAGLLVATMDAIADGSARPVPQSPDGVSIAGKITVEDAKIRFTDPALAIDRRIRACTPKPGAWTPFGEIRLKLGPILLTAESSLRPGEVAVTKASVRVGTATADVELTTVQPPGGKQMKATDWARGLRDTDALRLG